jgi:hypothetical protein
MRKFSLKEDQFLKDNYHRIPAKRMAKMLGRSEGTARQRMKLLGIIVPPEIVEKFRLESRFKKGAAPVNKGKKQTDFMSKEAIERTKNTRFKKGQLPHNSKSDNAISIRADKSGAVYKYIRISKGKWALLHRYNWEKKHGKIPKGLNLVFRDRDTMNCDISNLEALTNAQLMKRNSVHNLPKPLAGIVQLRGVLNRQIRKHLKNISNEK